MDAPQSRTHYALRGRSGKAVTRLRVSDVGDDLSWRSGFGFVMVSLARRPVNTIHRVTPRARNAHLVRFGHVNMMGKLGVEAGSEHGRGDSDAGRLPDARKRRTGLRVSLPSPLLVCPRTRQVWLQGAHPKSISARSHNQHVSVRRGTYSETPPGSQTRFRMALRPATFARTASPPSAEE